MEDEARNIFKSCLIVMASLCYSYFIASKLPKGILRFLSLLPIVTIFTLLPLSLSRPIPSVLLGGFITWLANSKLLLYAFNLGPLSANDAQRSFIRFVFLAAFPIKIKEKSSRKEGYVDGNSTRVAKGQDVQNFISCENFESQPTKVIPLNYWSKCVLFIVLEVVFPHTKNMVIICCLMYLFIDITFGVSDLLVRATLGVEMDPPSNEPYLSTSLQDFWGKRWNRMISDSLRHTVYKPIRSTTGNLVGNKWAAALGVFASFLVSGLMHELLYYYMTRVAPTWEVTWFFVLHGVCVTLEMAVKRALGPMWKLHWVVSGPLTVGFVMVTGIWLFFPQIMTNHIDTKATDDIIGFGNYMKEIFM